MKVDDILVSWKILTFDRQLKSLMSPPFRNYELDWTKASENEQAEIIKILGITDDSHEQEFEGTGKQSETQSVGPSCLDNRMLRFRHMFVEKPLGKQKTSTNDSENTCRIVSGVKFNPDYFEDETGQEISRLEMKQIETGNKNIIIFNAEGVASIGPTDICSREEWTVDKVNTLFNFIQVVGLIYRSSWARKTSSRTTAMDQVVKCVFPTVENMCAVLTLFRQLYANDALLENACNVYKKHCNNDIKKSWLDVCIDGFKQTLRGEDSFISLKGCTVRHLLDVFLYGTGLVHSASEINRKRRNKLSELVKEHGREKVILAVNSSFWTVLKYAGDIFDVVNQDYQHWTEQKGCAKSDMFDIYSLLQSHSS